MRTLLCAALIAIAFSSILPAEIFAVYGSALPPGLGQPIFGWVRLPAYEVSRPGIGGAVWGYPGFYGIFGLPLASFAANTATLVVTAPPPKTVSGPAQPAAPPPPSKVKSVICDYYWPTRDQITGSGVPPEPRSSCR